VAHLPLAPGRHRLAQIPAWQGEAGRSSAGAMAGCSCTVLVVEGTPWLGQHTAVLEGRMAGAVGHTRGRLGRTGWVVAGTPGAGDDTDHSAPGSSESPDSVLALEPETLPMRVVKTTIFFIIKQVKNNTVT